MANLANSFVERGHNVDLLVTRLSGPFVDHVDTRVNVIDLRSRRMLSAVPKLVRYLRRRQPAVLLSAVTHANIVAILAGGLSRATTRIVVSERNHLSTASRNATTFRKRRVLPLLVRWLYRRAFVVIGISDGVVQDLIAQSGLPREKLTTIYNPVVTAEMVERQETADHPWFDAGETPVILSVGRLVPQKDYPTLLKAMQNLRSRRRCRLLILGEGSERERLEAMVRDLGLDGDVLLPGFVDNPMAFARQANVFVLASAWEGFGNVVVEALAAGCPVVATDCRSGPAEILQNGKYGRLVPVGDPAAMAQAIADTLDRPLDANLLKGRASDFAADKVADRYLEVMLSK